MSKLKHLVAKHLPEFVREDYPAFTEFVKAYYDWLELNHTPKIDAIVDIDNTLDRFVQYFKDLLDHDGYTFEKIDQRLYLKNIKDLYLSKGSSNSFKFLFRAMFGKEAEVLYPWEATLKVSDGKWQQDVSIFVNVTTGNGNNFRARTINIAGQDGIVYTTFVSNVVSHGNNIYELYIDRYFKGRITWDCDVRLEDNSIIGRTIKTTSTVKIKVAGEGFQVGQIFPIKNGPGAGSVIKIKTVGPLGEVKAVELISFGTGYENNFTAMILPKLAVQNQVQPIITMNLDKPSPSLDTLYSYPSVDNVKRPEESGIIVEHDYTNPINYSSSYFTDLTYVGKQKGQFSTESFTGDISKACVLLFELGVKCQYPGYYNAADGILDDAMYIQDSYFYQLYSYVTSLDETLESYKNVVKKTLHPAGAALFANYTIINDFGLTIAVESALNILLKEGLLIDSATTNDLTYSFVVNKNILNDFANTNDTNYFFTLAKGTINEIVQAIDTNYFFTITKNVAVDTVTADDETQLVLTFTKSLSDAATTLDNNYLFNINKNINESITTSNSGNIRHNPYIVVEEQYWELGYFLGEYAFTT